MDQTINNGQNDFLWTLLANPAEDAHLYNYNLQRLVNDFPQSGILQALLAHSSDEKNLRRASAYFNSRALYKLINNPTALVGVADEKIILQNGSSPVAYSHSVQIPEPEVQENYFSDFGASIPEETNSESNLDDHTAIHEASAAENEPHTPEANHSFAGIAETIRNIDVTHLGEQIDAAIPAYDDQQSTEQPVENTHSEATAEPLDFWARYHPGAESPSPIPAEHSQENTEAAQTEESPKEEHTETMAEVPLVEPIINYARGLGHRMPADPDGPEENSSYQEDAPAVEHAVTEHTHEHQLESFVADAPVEEPIVPHVEPVEYTTEQHYVQEEATAPVEQPEAHEEAAPSFHENQPEIPEHHAPAHDEPTHAGQEQPQQEPHVTHPLETPATGAETHEIEDEVFEEIVGVENMDIEPDIIGSISATDYFTFDRAFGAHKEPEPVSETSRQEEVQTPSSEETDQQDLSKYHDEKMPYSFLWWLDKTRKEHAGVYQPYVAPAPQEVKKPGVIELEQQYYENIFHINSLDELDKSVPPPLYTPPVQEHKLKEQSIIDRFIEVEPQIRPQSSDKLDNENKAKKSAEDRDELVSETLAAIYTDQMLYHKAIASYKKLMLKYPEKSRYFADKIEQLEKKTN